MDKNSAINQHIQSVCAPVFLETEFCELQMHHNNSAGTCTQRSQCGQLVLVDRVNLVSDVCTKPTSAVWRAKCASNYTCAMTRRRSK